MLRAMGRPRGHQQLVAGGAADPRRTSAQEIHREVMPWRWWRAHIARSTSSCRSPRNPIEPARVYRKIGYGPLLDVFMLDMRSYRGPNGEDRQDELWPGCVFPRADANRLAEARARRLASATWKVIAADMPISIYVVYDADRKFGSEAVAPARQRCPTRPRTGDRRSAGLHQAREGPQHGVADRGCALHGGALVRSQQGREVPGLRSILGVRIRTDPRGHVRSRRSGLAPSGRN